MHLPSGYGDLDLAGLRLVSALPLRMGVRCVIEDKTCLCPVCVLQEGAAAADPESALHHC